MTVVTEADFIADLRRQARECGLDVIKSTAAVSREKNRGGYRIVDLATGAIIAGHRFELTHRDVSAELERIHVI